MCSLVAFFCVVTVVLVHGYKYRLEVDMEETMRSECEKIPGRGLSKFIDLSNFPLERKNDNVFINGSVSFLWNDDGRFKRVEVRGVTERYLGGSWGPTTLNVAYPDLCTLLFDRGMPLYQTFYQHVKEGFRNCTYNKGYIMDFEPFMMDPMEITISGMDITGIYRMTVYLIPYDKRNMKMTDSIYCFVAPFDFVRI